MDSKRDFDARMISEEGQMMLLLCPHENILRVFYEWGRIDELNRTRRVLDKVLNKGVDNESTY